MDIQPATPVAEIAARHPATIRVFQEHGVDFCCGGKRPLGEVCGEHGLAFDALRTALERAIAGAPPDQRAWHAAPLGELVQHIVERYHVTLRRELPRLSAMMDKVLDVHGRNHTELAAVAHTYRALVDDLGPHMMKEERVLFPFIARLEADAALGRATEAGCFGSVENPIRAMEFEHEAVGQLLVSLREHTRAFTPPDDACNTYRGLYHGFADLERELHEHIHIENNVLHPRALELERAVLA